MLLLLRGWGLAAGKWGLVVASPMPSDIGCSTYEHAIVLSSGSIFDYTGVPINLPVPWIVRGLSPIYRLTSPTVSASSGSLSSFAKLTGYLGCVDCVSLACEDCCRVRSIPRGCLGKRRGIGRRISFPSLFFANHLCVWYYYSFYCGLWQSPAAVLVGRTVYRYLW